MDVHPIFVHFPIALLTIYGLMELIWLKRLKAEKSWFYVKASFLILGVMGAFASLTTGDIASELGSYDRVLVHTHEFWANATTYIFLVLAIAYVVHFVADNYPKLLSKTRFSKTIIEKLWELIIKIKNIILFTPLIYLVVIAGLIAITITGALGGALVYGIDADPFISFVYGLLV